MPKLTVESLAGGHLAEVMSERMLKGEDLLAKGKPPAPKTSALDAFEAAFGWRPPREIAEWEAVAPAYGDHADEISDVWMISGGIGWVEEKGAPLARLVNDYQAVLLLTTGLERFGDDPCGDGCYLHTLPTENGLAGVHVFDHETGKLDGADYRSIADFVFSCWTEDEEDDGADAITDAFHAKVAPVLARRPAHRDPHALFDRVKWMLGLPCGEPGYRFAEQMSAAPDFATWEKEKALLADEPALANYWMLAHYFLGNLGACAEAVALGRRAKGKITPELATMVGGLLEKPKAAKLGKLAAKALAEMCATARKNAPPELLEPAVRAATEKTRAGDVKRASPKDLERRLAAGEDPWALAAEFPDDVAAHDLLLPRAAAGDKALAKQVADYLESRAGDSDWPEEWETDKVIDRRLSPFIGAAFRSGLRYDADGPKSFSALASALGRLDDDQTMASWAAALDALKGGDPRLKHAVINLRRTRHPRRAELLHKAGWRYFDLFDESAKEAEKKAKRGPTLDDVFDEGSYLLPALETAIGLGDAEAERLAAKVLSYRSRLSVLATALAAAFRLVGEKRLAEHEYYVAGYLELLDGFSGEGLPDYGHCNLAEAALAAARLKPEQAEKRLRAMLARPRSPRLHIEIAGGVLAGLLVLAPTDPELLALTERVLGDRVHGVHIYGALRGVAEARIAAAKPWVAAHLYTGCSSSANHIGENRRLLGVARDAMEALGASRPPEFDASDEFGSKLPLEKLPEALLKPGQHLTDWIFKRIREKNVRIPAVLDVGGEVLRDRFRFSEDEGGTAVYTDERLEGLKTLMWYGAEAVPTIAGLLELPHIARRDKTLVLFCLSVISDLPALLRELVGASQERVFALLASPPARWVGLVNVIAGWAFAAFGEAAREPVEKALAWRLSLLGDGEGDVWSSDEPTLGRLVAAASRFPGTKSRLAKLREPITAYQAGEAFERASDLPPVEALEGAGVALKTAKDSPGYAVSIQVDGASVQVEYVGKDVYFQGMLDYCENTFTHAASLTLASDEVAGATADRLARAFQALGICPEPKKRKKSPAAKSKSKKR